ncbi:MAG: hypothetical protein ACLQFI_02245 [Methylocella sp.]
MAFGIKIGAVSRRKFEARTLKVTKAVQPLLQEIGRDSACNFGSDAISMMFRDVYDAPISLA